MTGSRLLGASFTNQGFTTFVIEKRERESRAPYQFVNIYIHIYKYTYIYIYTLMHNINACYIARTSMAWPMPSPGSCIRESNCEEDRLWRTTSTTRPRSGDPASASDGQPANGYATRGCWILIWLRLANQGVRMLNLSSSIFEGWLHEDIRAIQNQYKEYPVHEGRMTAVEAISSTSQYVPPAAQSSRDSVRHPGSG